MARSVDPRPLSQDRPIEADGRFFTFAALIIAAACLAGMFLLPRISLSGRPKPTREAPAFVLPVIHNGEPGSRLELSALKGSPVLIDFWATWCGPCNMQTPILDRLSRRYEGKGLKVVGINVIDDDAGLARRYAQAKGLSYPIVVDDKGLTQREYDVRGLPSLILIDREGRIVHQTSGLVDEATLDRMIRETL